MPKKALLVGINDYAPVGSGGPDLRGCVNDVSDMANTLSVLGIIPATPRAMRILTNSRATRAAILAGLKWLVKGAKKGDVLVFYYSGHGSYVADVSGDELDGRDETLCPHDYASAGMIKDDDIRTLLAGLSPGATLDIIFDSCHSGSGTRAALDPPPGEHLLVSRFIEPPIDYGFFLDAEPSLPVRRLLKPRESAATKELVLVPGLNHVLWAGCRDNQTSQETVIGGVYRGVFTYHFCKVLRGAGVGILRHRLDAQVSSNIHRAGYAQIPQLEGTRTSLAEKVFT